MSARRSELVTPDKLLSWLILVGVAVASCVVILGRESPPPYVHDEWVNLLIADTLTQGRLSNPPHPFSTHFETVYVLQKPAYAGVYPLGTGALLAAGQLLTGRWDGGIAVGAVCVLLALFYAFASFVSPVWSAAGAGYFTFLLTFSTYWNSYWNGFVGVTAGALALGALRRWCSQPSVLSAAVFTTGCALACFTRPFEGAMLTVVLLCIGTVAMVRSETRIRPCGRSMLAAGAIASAALAVTMLHNRATTGSWFMLPQAYDMLVHGVPQPPVWLNEIPEPPGLSESQRSIYQWQRDARRAHTLGWKSLWERFSDVAGTIGYVKLNLLLMITAVLLMRNVWSTTLTAGALAGLIGGLGYWYFRLHYYGPFYPMFLLVLLLGANALMRLIGHLPRTVRIAAYTAAAGMVFLSALRPYGLKERPYDYGRTIVEDGLKRSGGRHLVFVQYDSGYNYEREWIYNWADIDKAPVVFARTLGPEQDRALRSYFRDRKSWLVRPRRTPLLQPLPGQSLQGDEYRQTGGRK